MEKMIKVTYSKGETYNKGETYCVTPEKSVAQMLDLIEETAKAYPELNTKYEIFNVAEIPLEKLPEEIKDEVKETLKAFDKCNVVYEYGKFSVSVGTCLKSKYNYDHFVCGYYKADDVYTKEERRQNYIEVFGN